MDQRWPNLFAYQHSSKTFSLSSAEKKEWQRFRTTWWWVNNDIILIFGLTIPLKKTLFGATVCISSPISRQFVHILRGYIRIRTTSLVQIHMIFAKSYVFHELPIRMNLKEWSTPNPAPKPTRHWGFKKSYWIVWVRSYELATSQNMYELLWDRVSKNVFLLYLQ